MDNKQKTIMKQVEFRGFIAIHEGETDEDALCRVQIALGDAVDGAGGGNFTFKIKTYINCPSGRY